jgi:hypothetical protein
MVKGKVCVPSGNQRCNQGGVQPAPNTPLLGWRLCADLLCTAVVHQGELPVSVSPIVGRWHSVSLEVTGDRASAMIDNLTLAMDVEFSVVPSMTPSPACVSRMIVSTARAIVGHDYRQTVLSGNTTQNIQACVKQCCDDSKCQAWAVAASAQRSCPSGRVCCWLKSGGSFSNASGEIASGLKKAASEVLIPESGWAGLVSTLGRTQVDNFVLRGTATGGAAAEPCAATVPTTGNHLVSTPCDFPTSEVSWSVQSDGKVRLRPTRNTTSSTGQELCIGVRAAAATSSENISLVQCGSVFALVFNRSTGRISPRANPQMCVTAVQKQPSRHKGGLWGQLTLTSCSMVERQKVEGVEAAQQFVHNPGTGVLRYKGSECIATFAGSAPPSRFRDCCLSYCMPST